MFVLSGESARAAVEEETFRDYRSSIVQGIDNVGLDRPLRERFQHRGQLKSGLGDFFWHSRGHKHISATEYEDLKGIKNGVAIFIKHDEFISIKEPLQGMCGNGLDVGGNGVQTDTDPDLSWLYVILFIRVSRGSFVRTSGAGAISYFSAN
ncbi:MAG: hypothetical protein JSW12_13840 [Deltaproteobacteria bacterium]|nr:MAG: hypothetical protein JSW12_13840 [Deltaproteobacteria bacterium]